MVFTSTICTLKILETRTDVNRVYIFRSNSRSQFSASASRGALGPGPTALSQIFQFLCWLGGTGKAGNPIPLVIPPKKPDDFFFHFFSREPIQNTRIKSIMNLCEFIIQTASFPSHRGLSHPLNQFKSRCSVAGNC